MNTTDDESKTVHLEVTKIGEKVQDFCAVIISSVPMPEQDGDEKSMGFTVSFFGGVPDDKTYDENNPPVSEVLARGAVTELVNKLEASQLVDKE